MPDGCQRKSTDAAKWVEKKVQIARAHLSCFIRIFSDFSAGLEVVNWVPVVDL